MLVAPVLLVLEEAVLVVLVVVLLPVAVAVRGVLVLKVLTLPVVEAEVLEVREVLQAFAPEAELENNLALISLTQFFPIVSFPEQQVNF